MARTIFVEIIGSASQFKKELEGAVASTNKANSGFTKMSKAAGVAGLALAGGLAVGLEKSVKAAEAAEVSTQRMDKAFANAHVSIKQYTSGVEAAEKAGRALGFTNTETRQALGSLVTATKSGADSLKDLGIAEDLARFKGVDLESATKALTMAHAGSLRPIKQLGIDVPKVTTALDALKAAHKATGDAATAAETATAKAADKQATFKNVLEATTAAVHGQAQAFSETSAGKMQEFHAQIQGLEESLGKGLLPALTAVVGGLATFAGVLAQHTTLVKIVVIAIAALSAALITLSVAAAIADAAMSPLLLPIAAAAVAIAALSFVVYKLVTDFRNSWPLLLPIVLGPLGAIIAACIHWHSQIAGIFTAAWEAVRNVTITAWNAIRNAVVGALTTVRAAVESGFHAVVATITGTVGAALAAAEAVGRAIVQGIKNGLAAIVGAVTGAFGRVWGAIRGLAGAALAAGEAVGSAIMHGVASGITGAVGSAIHAAENAVGGVLNSVKKFAHIGSPSRLFADEVGIPLAQGILEGLDKGLNVVGRGLIGPVADAKASVDSWAADTGVKNMAGVGSMLSGAFQQGFGGGIVGPAVTGAIGAATFGNPANLNQLAADAGMIRPGGASGNPVVTVNLNGPLMGSTVPQVAETIRRELLRIQGRNTTLGLR